MISYVNDKLTDITNARRELKHGDIAVFYVCGERKSYICINGKLRTARQINAAARRGGVAAVLTL